MSAQTDTPVAPGARAVARYVRTSASKARRVVNLVRGLPAKEALTVLQFAPQGASVPVYKVLASAIANAENNEQLDPDSLLISEAYVNEGPTMRRYRPRAQMRPGPIRKRTCHITIAVEAVAPEAPRRPRKQTARPASSATSAATGAPAKKSSKKAAAKQAATPADPPAEQTAEATDAAPEKAPAKKSAKKAAAKKSAATPAAAKKTTKKAPAKAAEEETE